MAGANGLSAGGRARPHVGSLNGSSNSTGGSGSGGKEEEEQHQEADEGRSCPPNGVNGVHGRSAVLETVPENIVVPASDLEGSEPPQEMLSGAGVANSFVSVERDAEASGVRVQAREQTRVPVEASPERRRVTLVYFLLLFGFLTVQFGHGANIGVAVSLPGSSKAMNLAMGSWVMVGVCVGLICTPRACKRWGAFRVCCVCMVIDLGVILLMLVDGITLQQIYAVRFLVGFFEAPLLPYLQEWLSRHGRLRWNVWNTVLHAMVPLGENLGYMAAQELVDYGLPWQAAFAAQAAALGSALLLVSICGGKGYLDLPVGQLAETTEPSLAPNPELQNHLGATGRRPSGEFSGVTHVLSGGESEVEYAPKEDWLVYWTTNCSLAAQLAFFSGAKYVIRDYCVMRGYSLRYVIITFSGIALVGPASGGTVAMSGKLIRPDRWSQHRQTLAFLAFTSSLAAVVALLLHYAPEILFWPTLFVAFVAAGGVYPAAQGLINISLTERRVIEASAWQVQCNNILFAMPMPYLIGQSMDSFGVGVSWQCIIALQVLAAAGFILAAAASRLRRRGWRCAGGLGSGGGREPAELPATAALTRHSGDSRVVQS